MTGFMQMLFLLDRWWRRQGFTRRIGSDPSKLASIVRIDGNAKADRRSRQLHSIRRPVIWRNRAPGLPLLLGAILLAGCTRASLPQLAPPPALPAAPLTIAALPAEQALPALVLAERTAAAARDLATLRQLWAEDARIVDSRGTTDPADDYIWDGRAAILDRYTLAVFPAPPPEFAAPPDLAVTRQTGGATATAGIDRWRFTFAEGRWWLQELAY
jgi:hypothetical protein